MHGNIVFAGAVMLMLAIYTYFFANGFNIETYHVIMHLLDTKMLTENQLNNIKSRFERTLTTQDNKLINSMIDIVREANELEQGTFAFPFNTVRAEIIGRTVSVTPDHGVRVTANQAQASNQTLLCASRGSNDSWRFPNFNRNYTIIALCALTHCL